MHLYILHVDGFEEASPEFHADAISVERAAFDTALEVSRCLRRLVFVTVHDSEGRLVCTAPRLPAANAA